MGLFPSYQQPKQQSRLFRPAMQDDPDGVSPPMGTSTIPGIPTAEIGGLLTTPESSLLSESDPYQRAPASTDDLDHSFPGDTNAPAQVKRNRLFGQASDESATPSFQNTPKQVQKIRLQGGAVAKTPGEDEQVTHGNFPEISKDGGEKKEKKLGLLGRLFGYQDPAKQDELGLEVPQKEHRGVLSTILQYALPTLFGAASGVGILPGLMTATAQEGNKENRYQKAMQDYAKLRGDILTPSGDMKTFAAYSQMTPEQQKAFLEYKSAGSINPLALQKFQYDIGKDRAQADKEALGERIPAATAMTLAEGEQLPTAISDLRDAIGKNANAMGPVMGKLRSLNPYDKQTQALNAHIKRVKQVVGKFLEGGVLRKEDEEKYDKILAGIENDPRVAVEKLTELEGDIAGKYNNYLSSLGSAGYNVSKFKQMKTNKSKTKPQGATHIGIGPDGKKHYADEQGNDLGLAE